MELVNYYSVDYSQIIHHHWQYQNYQKSTRRRTQCCIVVIIITEQPTGITQCSPVVLVFELDAPKRFEVVDAALFPNKLVVAAAGFAVDPNKLVVPLVFV